MKFTVKSKLKYGMKFTVKSKLKYSKLRFLLNILFHLVINPISIFNYVA